MQYILDEEEMEEVRKLRKKVTDLPDLVTLQDVCTKAANEWPSFKGWDGDEEPTPWGCIITEKYEHYCDKCPVQKICPYPWKEYSK